MTGENPSKPSNFWRWFDPRFRQVGTFAFIMNRLSGIGLTVYLFLHLLMVGKLAQGAQAYDSFIALVKNPIFLMGEFIVVVGVLLHGLNGLRIALTSFGIGNRYQRQLFYGLMAVAVFGCLYFAIRMFGGE
jgi:succinate dehydrogenase / fumarate reductase cytochrome b subunit